MSVVSTASAYKAALVSLFQNDPVLGQLQVVYGTPAREIEHESVEVGNITYQTEDWSSLGNRSKDETYGINVFIYVTTPGNTQQEATERAFEILGYIETLLRDNVVMAGVLWAQVVPQQLAEAQGDQGGMAMASAQVVVKARKSR